MNLTLLLSKIGLSASLSQDLTLLLVVIFVSFVFGMFIGRYKLISILINIYVSLAIINAFPESYLSDYTYKLIGFFILLVLLTLAGKKLFEIHISGAGTGFLWRVFAMSFLEVVMLISVALTLVPKKIGLEYVSPSSYEYLASENARLFWLIIPLAFMVFIHKRLNR
jgi:hypothetical protein